MHSISEMKRFTGRRNSVPGANFLLYASVAVSTPRRCAMKKLLFPLALAALTVSGAAGQSAFEGTWKIDFNKVAFADKPDEYLLQNGVYTCKSCADTKAPIKADGTDQ